MPTEPNLLESLTRRYGHVEPEALSAVLCPLWIPIRSIDRTVDKLPGQNHYRASFSVAVTEENREVLVRGRTGKFVSHRFIVGDSPWGEIAKGRIIDVDPASGVASGEIYCGHNTKKSLEEALSVLSRADFLEIDQYGASAKILSALTEYEFSRQASAAGYTVHRMPEDMAKHLGAYCNFDFLVSKGGVSKKVEAKSL